MIDTSFLPTLSSSDIIRAAQLIQQAYGPPTQHTTPNELKRFQQELFEIQKHPEAWGLVIPLLDYQDQNVQFFGAHTAAVKIARDWDAFPQEHAQSLRDLLVQLTAHSVAIGRSKFILRKLFVALSLLALKLVPGRPTRWPDWIMTCVTSLSGRGVTTEHIHDFLAIVAEEVGTADLVGPSKVQVQQSLADAIPMVVQAITSSIDRPAPPNEIQSSLRCLQAWMPFLPSNDLTPLIPLLISLLDSSQSNGEDAAFLAASDALQELLSKSALSDGSGSKTLTEPLLMWLDQSGRHIVSSSGEMSEKSHSLCKLLAALGDHSTTYIAANIASPALVSPPPSFSASSSAVSPPPTRAHLTQTFLRLLLSYTAFPGYFGVDEEESELVLGFWYLFQEALWAGDYYIPEGSSDGLDDGQDGGKQGQMEVAKAVYIELVQVLRRKVAFPPTGHGWSKDQVEKFQVYRRDVGDTLINAYYILRDDMLRYYVNDIVERLAAQQGHQGWEDIEATLHCVMSVQEALDLDNTSYLTRLFSPEILGRLPQTGHDRIRRTTLSLIGTYSSWFAARSAFSTPNEANTSAETNTMLLTVVSYVVSALTDPLLCLSAANSLRLLCDANRKALAPHMGAFAELHAGLGGIPDAEKSKVLQSIASVIQALPPEEEIPPIEAMVNPVVQKMFDSLPSVNVPVDESRAMCILQLEILSGVARGLTRTTDALLTFDESPDSLAEAQRIKTAREDLRMVKLRGRMFDAIRACVEVWSADVSVGHALSDLFKSITSLPQDMTLITLPAGPLLELVCVAAQKQLTAAWLTLAAILIAQMNPPALLVSLKSGPTPEAEAIARAALAVLLQASLSTLGQVGAMAGNPDIVQEFFACMDRTAQDFTSAFYSLPPGALDALMQCAISALALQERYSLGAACNFIITLIHRSALHEDLVEDRRLLLQTHGRPIMSAVLRGLAGVAPRSVCPNLIEILSTLLTRCPEECRQWIPETLYANDFIESKAGAEAKDKFVKAVLGSRGMKKTRDAAQQFILVARGLEGSSFGYASVSM